MAIYPLDMDTLGKLRDFGYRLFAGCTAPGSGHGDWLDLDVLIERFGEDYVFINETRIGAACVCKKCGHRGATLTLHPIDGPSWAN